MRVGRSGRKVQRDQPTLDEDSTGQSDEKAYLWPRLDRRSKIEIFLISLIQGRHRKTNQNKQIQDYIQRNIKIQHVYGELVRSVHFTRLGQVDPAVKQNYNPFARIPSART